MTTTSYRTPSPAERAIERFEIHDATCRARRAGLACSTCSDLYERALRAFYAARLAGVA
jgi:hypothetical protein